MALPAITQKTAEQAALALQEMSDPAASHLEQQLEVQQKTVDAVASQALKPKREDLDEKEKSPQEAARATMRATLLRLGGMTYIETTQFIADKLIPQGVDKFEMVEHPDYPGITDVRNFTMTYPSDLQGTIAEVGPKGYQQAVGVVLTAQKVIKGTFYGLRDVNPKRIVFADNALSANKGMFSPTIRLLQVSMDEEQINLTCRGFFGDKNITWNTAEFRDTYQHLQWQKK